MTTLLAATLTLLLVALVVALLERTNRRTTGLPHAPFGVDARSDADLGRLLHDLDAHRW